MKMGIRHTPRWLCTILLLSSLFVLPAIAAAPEPRGPDTDHTTASTSTSLSSASITTSILRETIRITTWDTTTRPVTTTVKSMEYVTATISSVPLIPGILYVIPEVIPALILGLAILVFAFLGSAVILRSRSSRTLEQLDHERRLANDLRIQHAGASQETGSSAASALKRLLELGILQPREYMEKKVLADRIEKKTSAKQLLDEGLISKEQYETLTGKRE